MGKIKRSKRSDNFTIIDNEILQRSDITWKAKGILCYLLSLPDDWEVYKTELPNHSKDGYDSTVTGFNELVSKGYITERRARKEDGSFDGMDYEVFDKPQILDLQVNKGKSPTRDFPESGSPESGFPNTGFPDLLNTNSKKDSNIKRDEDLFSNKIENFKKDQHDKIKGIIKGSAHFEVICMNNTIDRQYGEYLLDKFFNEQELNEDFAILETESRSHFNRWTRLHKSKYVNDYRDSFSSEKDHRGGDKSQRGGVVF